MRFRQRSTRAVALLAVVLLGADILAVQAGRENAADRRRFFDRHQRFTVMPELEEIGIKGFFTEVSGLGSESDVLEFRDESDPNVVRKIPGTLHWPDITLKRGITSDASLWEWRRAVEMGNVGDARANGTLVLLDRGQSVARWRFVNAWPAKISGPELDAEGNDVAIEELVIAHEGMTRES